MRDIRQLIPHRVAKERRTTEGSECGRTDLGCRRRAVMPQLLQRLQTRAGAVGVLAGRIARDDELVGLRGIDEQALALQALTAQQGNLRLQVIA